MRATPESSQPRAHPEDPAEGPPSTPGERQAAENQAADAEDPTLGGSSDADTAP